MRIVLFGYLKAGKRGKSSGVAWKPRVHPLNIRRHGWCGRTKSSRRSSPGIPTRSASRATKNSEIRDKQHHDLIGGVERRARCGLRGASAVRPLDRAIVRVECAFLVARLDGLAVGCGGLAMFDDYAEVKRMYTGQRRVVGELRRLCYAGSRTSSSSRQVGLAARNGELPASGYRSLRTDGISATESIRPVWGNACPQHRDEPLFREGAPLARLISRALSATSGAIIVRFQPVRSPKRTRSRLDALDETVIGSHASRLKAGAD